LDQAPEYLPAVLVEQSPHYLLILLAQALILLEDIDLLKIRMSIVERLNADVIIVPVQEVDKVNLQLVDHLDLLFWPLKASLLLNGLSFGSLLLLEDLTLVF